MRSCYGSEDDRGAFEAGLGSKNNRVSWTWKALFAPGLVKRFTPRSHAQMGLPQSGTPLEIHNGKQLQEDTFSPGHSRDVQWWDIRTQGQKVLTVWTFLDRRLVPDNREIKDLWPMARPVETMDSPRMGSKWFIPSPEQSKTTTMDGK